jgi:acylphosphatase
MIAGMSEAPHERRRYRIEGRVQGVGFRAFVQRRARGLALDGYVRNLDDGAVEALASGPPEVLARFEAELRRGPPLSRVDRLTIESLPDPAEPDPSAPAAGGGFEVRR